MCNLIINNGSTSLRFTIFNDTNKLLEGKIENIGSNESYYKIFYEDNKIQKEHIINNIDDAFLIMNKIINEYYKIEKIDAIGIRILCGGNIFNDSTILNNDELLKLKKLKNFFPLHFPNTMRIIQLCNEYYNKPLIGVFDNLFHNTIPLENALYGIPFEYYLKYGIKKYGYHGISYSSIVSKYSENNNKNNMNSIICHLGGGSSICNIKNGKSFDTTMGFSPNSGLIMSSRCGDIDSSIIFYLNELGFSIDEIKETLNSNSGYNGFVGYKDAKKIVTEAENNNDQAILLRKIIDLNFKKNLLGMMAINKPNEIIITGGIGTKNKEQREMLFSNLEEFNISINKDKNNIIWDTDGLISEEDSIPVYVMVDEEEQEINKECIKIMKKVNL